MSAEDAKKTTDKTEKGAGSGITSSGPVRDTGEILHTRAAQLALESIDDSHDEDRMEVVAFVLAGEIYGIESAFVREVTQLKNVTQLPSTPPFVFGITNVRGRLLSVINLKNLLHLPARGITDMNKILIVRTSDLEVGLLVDDVKGIQMICPETLQTSLATLTGVQSDYLRGVTQDQWVILDIQKILADPGIIVCEEVEQGAEKRFS
jgi:purine-binding chemotaxis protein CheW